MRIARHHGAAAFLRAAGQGRGGGAKGSAVRAARRTGGPFTTEMGRTYVCGTQAAVQGCKRAAERMRFCVARTQFDFTNHI